MMDLKTFRSSYLKATLIKGSLLGYIVYAAPTELPTI